MKDVNKRWPGTPPNGRKLSRRNRDDSSRHEAADSLRGASRADAPQEPASAPPTASASVEAVLGRGHAWLRFPTALEAQFQSDTLEPRRRLLMICGLLGIISIYFGTLNIAALNPDIVAMALRVAQANVAASALGLAVVCFIPKLWRRTWQAEGVTALIAVGTCAGLINGCIFSRADTTFTHSAVLVSVVMYTCIAARQRFVWSLGCTVLPLLGYAMFVKGFTPHQELIVIANLKLMALSFALALVANYTFEHRERRNWLLRKLEEYRRGALVETTERLHILSIQDPLTGLLNRRQFDTDLAQAWSTATRTRQAVAMLMVDVDFFKRYNDTYGHPAGDACLVRVSQALTKVAQAHGGIAARLGGEEFGLLLPGRTLAQAMDAGTALCDGLRDAGIEHRTSSVAGHVTLSVGAAQAWPTPGSRASSLITSSDQALYQAKELGRDRVCAATAMLDMNQAEVLPPEPSQCEGMGAAQAEATVPPEAAYVHTLQGKFRWLRFPAEQEADYNQGQVAHRRERLMAVTVLGLLIYQAYVLSSRAMFPDVPTSALMAQLGMSAVLLIMAMRLHKLEALPPWWREALFSGGTSATAVMMLWVLSQSQQPSALSFSVCLALIPMFAGVGARQPFWFTCLPAVITCVAAAYFLNPRGALQTLVFNDSILMIVNNTVFTLILAYTLDHGARKAWLLSNIERLQRQSLVAATQRLHELSTRDPLTGICNRRQFEEDLLRIWEDGLQAEKPVAMLIIDVDFFKLYNDGYGHPAGDRCLKQVAATIDQVAKSAHALAARLGGEEFGILLPGGDHGQILQLGERVCAAVRQAGLPHRHSKVAGHEVVTVSLGAASLLPAKGGHRRALLAMADDALYQAKNSGRNRVAALRVPGRMPAHA
ncbi:MAG: hypothetical protein C0487_08000 [Leptothrix sp. (in: Bacteria)]|nr:hypothetical protein [Leptothrix sp. (in: b-proteobacteria)]